MKQLKMNFRKTTHSVRSAKSASKRLKMMATMGLLLWSAWTANAQMPTDSLKGYWSLDNNVADGSGNGNNGSLMGGAVYCPDRFGNANSAVKLGGYFNSSAIRIPNSASLALTNQLTIACWFKLDSIAGMKGGSPNSDVYSSTNSTQTFIAKDGDKAGFLLNYYISTNGNRQDYAFRIFNNTTCSNTPDFYYAGNQDCVNTEWVHVAVVVDAISITMYINGMQKQRRTYNNPQITFTEANTKDLIFGRFGDNCNDTRPNFWYPLNGKMDDIVYYNRALSQEEIQALYNYPSPYAASPMLANTKTINDYVKLGEVYEQNGFSLPAQTQCGTFIHSRTNGCDSTWYLHLTVNQPVASCTGDSITFYADSIVSDGGTVYFQWFRNDTAESWATDSIFKYVPAPNDRVRCRLVSGDGCDGWDTAYSTTFVVTVNPYPTITSSNAMPATCSEFDFDDPFAILTDIATDTITWYRAFVANITPATGSGGGRTINEALTNATDSPIDVIYLITATANGCTTTQEVVRTVNPTRRPKITIKAVPRN
jgi:hypothetical protein